MCETMVVIPTLVRESHGYVVGRAYKIYVQFSLENMKGNGILLREKT